jgi:hypothetical protein
MTTTRQTNSKPSLCKYWFEFDLRDAVVTETMWRETERVARKDKAFAGSAYRIIFFSFRSEAEAVHYRNELMLHMAIVGMRNNFRVELTPG